MSVRQSTDRSRWDVVPDLIFAGALTLSYASLYRLALAIGFPEWLAWIYPAIIDGFIIYAAHEATESAGQGERAAKRWAFALVVTFTWISGGLQAWDGYHRAQQDADPRLSAAAHAIPAVAVLLAFEMRQRRAARRTRLAAVATGATDRAAIEAEIQAAVEAEAAPLHAEIQRLTSRLATSHPSRQPLRALPGGTKRDRAVPILAARPEITDKQLAAEIGCTDRYARGLRRDLRAATPVPSLNGSSHSHGEGVTR